MRRFRRILPVLLGGVLLSGTVFAQTVTGALEGHVTDQAGGAVPAAEVLAHDAVLGVQRSTQTNEAGYFNLPFLSLGNYEVTVTAKGFATLVATGNLVTLNKTTTLNLVLKVVSIS